MGLIMYKNEHFEDVLRIYVDAFTSPPLNYNFVTKVKAERYIKDMTRTPCFVGYVYPDEEKITAFVFGTIDNYFDGTLYEVMELAVDPYIQRSGIGSKVMSLLESRLKGMGVDAISLNTSRHLPAFSFYKKNGYTEIEENVNLAKWL